MAGGEAASYTSSPPSTGPLPHAFFSGETRLTPLPPRHHAPTPNHRHSTMGKDTRVTYQRRHAYATRSNERVIVKTPGQSSPQMIMMLPCPSLPPPRPYTISGSPLTPSIPYTRRPFDSPSDQEEDPWPPLRRLQGQPARHQAPQDQGNERYVVLFAGRSPFSSTFYVPGSMDPTAVLST